MTATRCGASAIIAASVAATSSSLGLSPSLSALVESQISAIGMPSAASARKRASSVGGAAMGRGSSFQSPVWITRPNGRGDRQRAAFGDRVRNVDRLDCERPERERLADLHGAHSHVVDDVVGGTLGAQHGGGERRGIDRPIESRPEIEHGAVVVLVTVRQDQRQHVLGIVLEEARIGHDQLDAGLRRAGESDAAIDDDPFAAIARTEAVGGHVHADFADAAKRHEDELVGEWGGHQALTLAVTPKCTSPAVIAMRELSLARTISRPLSSMFSKMPRTTLAVAVHRNFGADAGGRGTPQPQHLADITAAVPELVGVHPFVRQARRRSSRPKRWRRAHQARSPDKATRRVPIQC